MVSAGLPNAVVTGLVTGSILALGAIGVSIIYRIAEVPNFAHGELFTFGAYIALLVNIPGRFLLLSPFVSGGALDTSGRAILFSLATVATFGTIYLFGGRSALEGDWWPTDPSPIVGVAAHGLLAVVVGGMVGVLAPSIWGGVILAVPIIAAISLLQERYVYRFFRQRGTELGTLLIVALGISIFLRNSIIALFTGTTRSFSLPDTISVLDSEVTFASAWLYDIYFSSTGISVEIIETATAGNPTILVANYSWAIVVIILAVTVGTAVAYLWQRDANQHSGAETFNPHVKAGIVGLGALVVGTIALGASGTTPTDAWYATRLRISSLKISMIVGTLLIITGLHVLLQETKLGTAMRASSDNLDLALVRGIDTHKVMMVSWIIAGVLGAVGGIMLGLLFNRVVPYIGFYLLLPMFAAVILGGGGKISGAIVGSYIVGLSEEVGLYLIPSASPSYRVPIAFAVLVIVLLIKPEGITGGR